MFVLRSGAGVVPGVSFCTLAFELEKWNMLRRGFTLIELLVVIAIIALLVGLLLPSLVGARKAARAVQCASNARQVSIGVLNYASDSKGFLPPSYVYAATTEGTAWTFEEQSLGENAGRGYIHWSYILFHDGNLPEGAFSCPEMYHGGAPAANCDPVDREPGQQVPVEGLIDRQVAHMAYTGNHALFPRNKFYSQNQNQRKNKLATTAGVDGSPQGASKTILATEFYNSPAYIGLRESGTGYIKSHRPITPFKGVTSGQDIYNEGDGGNLPRFAYADVNELLPNNTLDQQEFAIDTGTSTSLNAVGRHHPGTSASGGQYGGTASFAFVDGHVEQITVRETIEKRLWGSAFWTLTGSNNRVEP